MNMWYRFRRRNLQPISESLVFSQRSWWNWWKKLYSSVQIWTSWTETNVAI